MKRETDGEDGSAKKKAKKKDPKAGSGFDTRYKFKVEPQPPKFPFCGEYFDLNLYLVDQEGKPVCGYEVPIMLDLFVEGESIPVNSVSSGNTTSIEIDPATPAKINKNGLARLRVRVMELSMSRNNRKFCFMAKRQPGPRGDLPRDVNPVMTRAMLVVNYQIHITNQLPEVWYKDQGGRDKCIDIHLELRGPNGLYTGAEVPIRSVLLYEDFQRVINQDILQPSPTTEMVIGKSGKSHIRMRIEDVSKNHQSKNFRIRIEPDTSKSPVHLDKSPDVSSPVLVRSKLNRRQKQRLMEGEAAVKKENGAKNMKKRAKPTPGYATSSSRTIPQGMGISFPANGGTAAVPTSPDLAKMPPELAQAIWCQHTRETLLMCHHLFGRLVTQYDQMIHPLVNATLQQHSGQTYTISVGGESMNQGNDSSGDLLHGNNGGNESFLPGDDDDVNPSNVAPPLNFNDSGRGASLGLVQLMRGTTQQLLRGLSGSLGLGQDGLSSSDFPREISFNPNLDEPFSNALSKMPSLQSYVPRLNSLAEDAFDSSQPNRVVTRQRSAANNKGSGDVAYIIKQLYKVRDAVKGMPAFNRSKNLIGFYFRHGSGSNAITGFKELSQAQLSPEHIAHCENFLADLLGKKQTKDVVEGITSSEEGYAAADSYFQATFAS